jgi:hypothetical protein
MTSAIDTFAKIDTVGRIMAIHATRDANAKEPRALMNNLKPNASKSSCQENQPRQAHIAADTGNHIHPGEKECRRIENNNCPEPWTKAHAAPECAYHVQAHRCWIAAI